MKRETVASIVKAFIALAVIAALAFVIVYQNKDKQLGGEVSVLKNGEGASRPIEGYSVGQTLPFGDKALLLATNTFMLLDKNGRGQMREVSFSAPRARAAGKYIAAYDGGGKNFVLYKNDSELYDIKTEDDISAATVNENGYAAVACREEGGGTSITVYNDKGKPFYVWNLSSGQFVAMDLSADNTRLCISSISDDPAELRGEITVVRLDSEEKCASCAKEDEVYFDVRINRDYTVMALGSGQLDYYNADGTLRWSLPYDGKTLRCADIDDPDMAVLCYASADSRFFGSSTQVEVINRLGEISAQASFDGLCENLSVNGDSFAASAGKKIFIYNRKCELENEISSNSAVKKMSLLKNGSAFVLSGSGGSIINGREAR